MNGLNLLENCPDWCSVVSIIGILMVLRFADVADGLYDRWTFCNPCKMVFQPANVSVGKDVPFLHVGVWRWILFNLKRLEA